MTTKREIPARLLSDPGWRAALHILTSPLFEDAGGVWSHVYLERRSIMFDAILAGPWSGGELRMLRLAASLFNPDYKVALWSDLGAIDDDNALVALEAMRLFVFGGAAEVL
jgi:hypothetical protein